MTSDESLEIMKLFSERLKELLNKSGITQVELSNILGLSPSTVNKWLAQKSVPRMGIIEKLSAFFRVPKSYFLEKETDTNKRSYYLNPEAAQMAQEIYDNPQYKILFDATKKLKPESIKEVMKFIDYQKAKEEGE